MRLDSALYKEDVHHAADVIISSGVKNATILITGASGMIGTFLIDAFVQANRLGNTNNRVIALSRNEEKLKRRFDCYTQGDQIILYAHDISEPLSISEKADYIIHAASNTHPREYAGDPIGTIMTNVLGTRNLLEYMKTIPGCRLTLLSSVEIYGEKTGDRVPFSEEDCGYIDCNTLRAGYPESKRVSETMTQAYKEKYDTDTVIVRLCRVYGATVEPDDSKASSQLIGNAYEKKDIVLKSDGEQVYSYLFLPDAASAILTVMFKGVNGEAYNAADTKSDVKLREMAKILCDACGSTLRFDIPDEVESRGFSKATYAVLSGDKLHSIGWEAGYSIEKGLKRTLEEMRQIRI